MVAARRLDTCPPGRNSVRSHDFSLVLDETGQIAHAVDSMAFPLILRGEFTIARRSVHLLGGAYGSVVLGAQRSRGGAIVPAATAKRIDVGWLAGVGSQFLSVAGGDLFIEARYQRGYRGLFPGSDLAGRSLSLVIGYALAADSDHSSDPIDHGGTSHRRHRVLTLRGGVIASRLRSAESPVSAYKPGFVLGGAFSPIRLGSRIAIAPRFEVSYVHRDNAGPLGSSSPSEHNAIALDSIDLAILARGEWTASARSLYGLAGLYSSILLRGQQTAQGRITDIRGTMAAIDAGWIAGAGIELQPRPTARFSLELRYQHGLRDLFPALRGNVGQQSFSILLGITRATASRPRSQPTSPDYQMESTEVVLRGSNERDTRTQAPSPRRVTSVGIGRPGDRWASTLRFLRIERATQQGQRGYRVTYPIAGHRVEVLFWPRHRIDFEGQSPGYSRKYRKLRTGRLWYPDRITGRSLPRVHHFILVIERAYARQASGAQTAMQGFAVIAGLGGVNPTLRTIAPRAPPRTSVQPPRRTSVRPTSKPAAANPAPSPPALATPAAATAAAAVAPSARALGKALEAAGHARPPGAAAHHIVAGKAAAAAKARDVLQRFGIGINDAVNGLFLPTMRSSPNPSGAAVHSTLHTKRYYNTVNQILDVARTRAEVEAILRALRESLLSGGL